MVCLSEAACPVFWGQKLVYSLSLSATKLQIQTSSEFWHTHSHRHTHTHLFRPRKTQTNRASRPSRRSSTVDIFLLESLNCSRKVCRSYDASDSLQNKSPSVCTAQPGRCGTWSLTPGHNYEHQNTEKLYCWRVMNFMTSLKVRFSCIMVSVTGFRPLRRWCDLPWRRSSSASSCPPVNHTPPNDITNPAHRKTTQSYCETESDAFLRDGQRAL